jgi:hypothetical protein
LALAESQLQVLGPASAAERDKPFPVRLLNRTDLIDRDRTEFLLSLA